MIFSSVQEVIASDVAKDKSMIVMSFFIGVFYRFVLKDEVSENWKAFSYFSGIAAPPPFITVLGATSSSVHAVNAIEAAKAMRSE